MRAVFLFAFFCCLGRSVVVNAPVGKIEGFSNDGVDYFLGIPFAKALRFENPDPVTFAYHNASSFGPGCPQRNLETESEDCLNLNIWRPFNTTSGSVLNVAVWIYGGGFDVGYDSLTKLEGQRIAKNGKMIVISFNYRVNALG